MKNKVSGIDFVITWVDGSDPKWLADRAKYAPKGEKIDESRYRDWGFLKYWFRAVEANAPWVRKIHFVTYGHIPEWLNTNHPKLHIVKHEDFIDKKYLPTFNSCAIEMNLHKIPGLAEKFVYFNDDMFLNKPVKPEFFFKNSRPRDTYVLSGAPQLINTARHINRNCNLLALKHRAKINLRYYSVKNGFLMALNNAFVAIMEGNRTFMNSKHAPASFLKQSFYSFEKQEKRHVEITKSHKFRTGDDISQWAVEFYQQRKGVTIPRYYGDTKYYNLGLENAQIINDITNNKHNLFCINDGEITSFDKNGAMTIAEAFNDKYPIPSSFESPIGVETN